MQGVERHKASQGCRGSAQCVRTRPAFAERSQACHAVADTIAMTASRDCPVMIVGETGARKEVVARQIHEQCHRWARPFVPADCTNVTGRLFQSQLFGRVRGAFTAVVSDTAGFSEPPAEAPRSLRRSGSWTRAFGAGSYGRFRNSTRVEDLHTLSWVCQRATSSGLVVKPGANATAAEHAAIGKGWKRWSTGRPLRRKPFHLSICMLGSAASVYASNPAANHHDGSDRCAAQYASAPFLSLEDNLRVRMREEGAVSGVGVLGCANRRGSNAKGWFA